MIFRFILGVIVIGSLTGCATVQKPTPAGQLQIKMAQLESRLEDQEESMGELITSVDDLGRRIEDVADLTDRTNARLSELAAPAKEARKPSAPEKKEEPAQILRVPVTPENVQTALKAAGYYSGTVDGILGPGSKRAIREFQSDHDLEVDGIIGKKTWTELKKYLE